MKKLLFLLTLFIGVSLGSASEAALNCAAYGGSAVSNTNPFPNGCPSNKPIRNDKGETSRGSHCCLTQTQSNKLDADYAAQSGSRTTTTSTRSTTSTSSGSTTTSASPSTQQAAATQYCDAPNTCVNSASGCPSAQPHNVSSATPCDPVKYPGRICCSTTNPTQSGGTGTTGSTSAVSITLSNPLKYDTIEGVLTSIMAGLKGIVVVLALLMIVIGGIMYIFSAGNDGRMKVAKNTILAALIGLAIVIAAPAFLKEISVLLGWDSAPAIEGGTQLTLTEIASNILKFLLSIIGILALIMMFVSGILYMASGGNDARVKQAKAMFVASLIGITVAMGSLVLVSAVARFFIP